MIVLEVQKELKFAFHFIATSYKTQTLKDTLANFIIRYRPPYIVQVLEEFDGPTEACSLSLDEIMTIHTVVRLRRIKVQNSKGRYFFLPVDNSARVEIVSKTRTRLSKGGLRSHARRPDVIPFLRALKEISELNLKDGDILEPIVNVPGKKSGPETLTCKILRQPEREIRLPLDYVVPFESFEEFDPRGYSLRYVADNIAFPVAVRFIGDVKFSPEARVALKGEFRFDEIVEESIVIATTKLRDQFTMLKLPVDLQVTVFPIRKLRCNAEYISKYWERLQPEIDKLETQITSVEDDLLPTSYFQEDTLSTGLEESGDGYHKEMDVSIVNEYASPLDGNRHVYESMKPPYLSSDEDYIYPEPDELEWSTFSYGTPKSSKERPQDLSDMPTKTSMKQRFLTKLTKVIPKSPPFISSKASGSPQGFPTSSSPAAPSFPFTSYQAAAGRDLGQSLPDDLGNLSVSKVSECLRLLNMGEHVEKFQSEQVDGQLFIMLNEDTLPCLGVSDKFQQQNLLKFIQGWRPVRNNSL